MADADAERRQEFGDAYDDYEPYEVTRLIVATGRWLDLLLGEQEAVDRVMKMLLSNVICPDLVEGNPDAGWHELWEQVGINDACELRIGQKLTELNAFAFYGLRPDLAFSGIEASEEDLARAIEDQIAAARALLDAIPAGWAETPHMRQTVLAAEARIRLDTGRDVTPEQLAALARVSLKSIKNLLAPGSGVSGFKLNERGEISGSEALRWLQARPDFKSSLWRSGEPGSADSRRTTNESLGEVVFVPVAKDGSWFDPATCRNGRGYTVGPKGAEEPVSDYREALDRLARMPTPYWRRPNAAGHWGIVAGVCWQRKTVAELASEAA